MSCIHLYIGGVGGGELIAATTCIDVVIQLFLINSNTQVTVKPCAQGTLKIHNIDLEHCWTVLSLAIYILQQFN